MGALKRIRGCTSNMIEKISISVKSRKDNRSENECGKTANYIPVADSGVDCHDIVSSSGLQADIIYFVYFLVGAGFLLPWQSFMTAVDYFDYLYPNSHIDRVFSIAYQLPSVITLVVLIVYGKECGARTRVNSGMGLFLVGVIVIPIMEAVFLQGRQGNSWTYSVTVFAMILAGAGDALVQATLVGTAGRLPERFMQGTVSGTGLSGVVISFLRIVTKASFPQTPSGLRRSANVYFCVTALLLILCIVSYNLVHDMTGAMVDCEEHKATTSAEKTATMDVESIATSLVRGFAAETAIVSDGETHLAVSSFALGSSSLEPKSLEEMKERTVIPYNSGFNQAFLQVKWLAGALFLAYVITLSIFPGSLTEDVKSAVLGDWYPVLLVAAISWSDFLGKTLATLYIPSDQTANIRGSLTRILFYPLYAVCLHGPHIFRTEIPVFLLTVLLGLTSGYYSTCFFVYAPKNVKSADAEIVGIVMVMALEMGLTVGALVSWVWEV